MRRLIVNADDLGYTSGVNRSIFEAHASGIVTSTTLMANGPAFAAACADLPRFPRLGVGCHIVITEGFPLSAAASIPSLIDSSRGKGEFRAGMVGFASRALFGQIDPREIERETTAQIARVKSAGISPTHVDTHKHAHIFPTVLRPILRAARECGVRSVRNPYSGFRSPGALLKQPGVWVRWAELRFLSRFEAIFRAEAAAHGLATTDGTLGVEVTGSLDESAFTAIAQSIPEGTWELVCHPGYNDADLAGSNTRLKESREIELRVLTSPAARAALDSAGVELISYRELG